MITWQFESMAASALTVGLFLYAFFYFRQKKEKLEWELQRAKESIRTLQNELAIRSEESREYSLENAGLHARVDEERKKAEEKMKLIQQAQEDMRSIFKAVSSDSLQFAQKSFFELAKETFDKYQSGLHVHMQQKEQVIDSLIKPLRESLEKVDVKIQELEKNRHGAYIGITEQLTSLNTVQLKLQAETSNLVKALRTPNVRGKWGEMQLRRVVEMAGMVEYCDFTTQTTQDSIDGKIRPDLLVRLPNSRTVVVDAKVPLMAYLEAIECSDEKLKEQKLKEHAKQLKKHLLQLGDKAYFESIDRTPEFVVLFLPGESFFSVALEQDPTLIEYGVDKKVLIATPTTLIALLRAVAFGWREEVVALHAEKISELGRSLYERLENMVTHFQKLKRSLDTAADAYNKVVGCFESRVLVAARRFQEMGVSEDKPELEELEPVEKLTRLMAGDFENDRSTKEVHVPKEEIPVNVE